MNKPKKLLIVAAVVAAISLSAASYAEDITIDSGTATLNTSNGSISYSGDTYSWGETSGNVLILDGGTISIVARSNGAITGVIQAMTGRLTCTGSGNNSNRTILNIGAGSSIAEAVNIDLGTFAILNVNNGGVLNIDSSDSLGSRSYIGLGDGGILNANGGSVIIQGTGGTLNITGGTLTLNTDTYSPGSIAADVVINSVSGSILDVSAGVVYLNSNDNLQGGLTLRGSGIINIQGTSLTSNGYTQSAGDLNISSSEFTVGEGSSVTGGNITLSDSSTLNVQNGADSDFSASINAGSGDSINVDNTSTVTLTGGTIDANTVLNVAAGSGMNVSGSSAVLNINNNDNYSGSLSVASGTANISNKDFITDGTVNFNMTGGTVNLDSSEVALNTAGSLINGGTINMQNNSGVALNNSQTNIASITTDSTSNTLDITADSTLEMIGGQIAEDTAVNIENGSGLLVNASAASASIDDNDVWAGLLEILNGTLTIKDKIAEASSGSMFVQTGGTSNISNSGLVLDTEDAYIAGGTLNFTDNSTLSISNGLENRAALNMTGVNNFNINNSSSFTMSAGSVAEETNVNLASGATLNISEGAALSLDDTDIWEGLLSSDGRVNMADMNVSTDENRIYQQAANDGAAVLNLDNTSLTINEGSFSEGGTINLSNSSDLTFQNNRNNYASINTTADTNENLTVADNTILTLQGGTITENAVLDIAGNLDISGATVTLDSDTDTLTGDLTLLRGTLTLKEIQKQSGFAQTGGILNVDASNLELTGDTDVLDGGSLNLTNNSSLTISNGVSNSTDSISTDESVNNIVIENSSNYTVRGGSITQPAHVTIDSGAGLTVAGADVTLDSATDNWNGSLALSSGTTSLQNFNGSGAVVTDSSKTFNQSGGTLNLNSSDITLNEGSAITSGQVNLTNASELIFNNGVTNTANITANDISTNILRISNNSTLTSIGGIINEAASVTIDSGAALNISGVNSDITISSEDTWDGQVAISNGTLNIKDGMHATDTSKTFVQTGGTLNLNGTSLQLNTENSYVNQGTVNLSNNSMLTFDNGRTDNTAVINTSDTSLNNLIVYENSGLTLTGGTINKEASVTIDSGADLTIRGAGVSLNNTDTWSGGITLSSGSLTLTDGLNAVTTANKTYVQNGGSLYVDNASLTLDTPESYISTGIGYLQNGGSLTIANGLDSNSMSLYANDNSASSLDIIENSTLTLTEGTVDTASQVNIDDGSILNTTGAIVNIDGASGDVWSGEIDINGGTLNVSNTNLDNGVLRGERGSITLGANSKLNLASGSIITGTMRTVIQDTGELHITGGTTAINNGDTWSGDIYLTDGSLSYTSLIENGNIYADGGSLSVYNTSGRGTLHVDGDSYINAATDVSLTGSGTFAITDGDVYFNEGDTWASNTLITLDGDGLFDYSDLTSGGRLQASSGNVDIHSGILNFTINTAYISEDVELTLDEGGKIFISNTSGVTINNGGAEGTNDTWNGDIELTGGTLNISGYEKTTSDTSTYTQSGGTLNLSDGTNLTLNEGSQITGSSTTINFASSGDTSSLTLANGAENSAILSTSGRGDSFSLSDNSEFTHVRGTIEEADTVNIGAGATFNLAGTASSRLSTLYLNEDDNYSGNIDLSSGYGRLYLNGVTKAETGTLVQSSSNAVTTITGDNFVFNNAGDNVSGGTLNIGTSSDNASVGVSAGTIAAGAGININDGSTLNISGGSVTVNAGDTWAGDINQTSGTLIYDGLTSNGGLNSTGGDFNLVGNAILKLGETSNISSATNVSIGANAEIDIIDGTSLSLDAQDEWLGLVHNTNGILNADSVNKAEGSSYIQEGADSVLNVTGTGFNLSGESDEISEGRLNVGDENGTLSDFTISNGTVADAVTVDVFENAALIIDGGELTLSDTDTVNGTLELRDGLLTLEDWILNAGYVQTGGLLDMYGSELHISDAGSSVSGAVHLNDNSLLDLSAASDSELEIQTDGTANSINIGAGNVTVNNQTSIDNNASVNISNGAGFNIASGTVNLNSGDTWAGEINNSANLNIDNLSKTGIFTQTDSGAVTNITGSGFDLGAVGDEVSAGQLNVGNVSQSGELAISIGTVGENTAVNLADGSSINISGGSLTLNDNDIWDGDIGASAGTLNILSPIEREGSLTLNGATANIYSSFVIDGNDSLTSGILNAYGDLALENNAEIASDVALTISRNTTVDIDNTSTLTVGRDDYWYGSINNNGTLNLSSDKITDAGSAYVQSEGVLNISDAANLTLTEGSSITNNGTVNLSEASGITFNNQNANSAVINTTDSTANSIAVSEGSSLSLENGTNINADAGVNFSGDVSIAGGNLVLNTGDILAGNLTNTGASVVFDGLTKSGVYTQNDEDALLSILSDLTLGSTDSITAGGLNIDGANLTLDGLSITDNIDVTIDSDGLLTISSGSSAYLSSDDTINGSIDNSGSLTVKDITLGNSYSHNNAELIMDNSRFNAQTGVVDGGSITLNNNSVLNISNGGSNSFGVNTDSTNNRLGIANNSTVTLESGNILEDTILNLSEGSKLTIGDASVSINDKGVSADVWDGTIELNSANSTLELVDFTSHVGELIAEQGNLRLSGNTVISLTDGSIAEAVALDIGTDAALYLSGASLNLDSADNWGGTIIMNNASSSLTLQDMVTDDASNLVAESGNLTLTNSTLNLTGTSQISSDVNVNIESDSTVNITGGNVTLDGLTDVWDGKLTISSGNLTLNDMEKSGSGIFQQTGGTTTILGTSFDMNNSEDYVQSGTLIVGDGINEALLTVSEGKIYDDATLVIRDNGEVNIINNGTGGESGSGSGGLDWAGHVQVDGGRLTIDDTEKR